MKRTPKSVEWQFERLVAHRPDGLKDGEHWVGQKVHVIRRFAKPTPAANPMEEISEHFKLMAQEANVRFSDIYFPKMWSTRECVGKAVVTEIVGKPSRQQPNWHPVRETSEAPPQDFGPKGFFTE